MNIQELLNRFPGVSCAYTDTAGNVRTAAFGAADKERSIPVDEDTIFPACSISKFITALCVMKLQERQLIAIDAPVNAYLHQWKLRTPDGCESDAAIRALLCHTAGITDGEEAFYGLRLSDPDITLMDILEGRTAYNSRPACAQKPQGEAFEYSDAGYCILQLLVQEVTGKAFEEAAREIVFAPLGLRSTFFASRQNIDRHTGAMATGYDGEGLPLPGRIPFQPDLAASALWTTPKDLLAIARDFLAALHGKDALVTEASAREMAAPVEKFPWTGLGVFTSGQDLLISQGWGENGQCMLKMNRRTGRAAVVMTNRNPEADQSESGVEELADQLLQDNV